MMKRLLILASLCALPILAQQTRYAATTGDVSLSGAGTALTIQQPATGARMVRFESAIVYCSVACNITQSQNGTAATATAGSAVPIMPYTFPAAATVWTASNVGAGTTIGPLMHLTAAGTTLIDLSNMAMGSAGTANNYTITISSITGTANITIIWNEQ